MRSVDVVIVAYRSGAVIEECIRAASRIPSLGQVVVVDHGLDGAGALAAGFGASVLADVTNPGFGAGQNRGVSLTTAPAVLLLNPDAVVNPEAVEGGLKLLESEPDVAAVQGVVLARDGQPERSQGTEVTAVHLLGRAVGARRLRAVPLAVSLARRFPALADHADRVPRSATDVEALAATAILVRRAAFDAVGGFDTSYFLYGEDLDLCRRLRVAGWRLVAMPDIWARHAGGGSARSTWEREINWWRGTMTFAARWWSAPGWAGAVAAALLRFAGLVIRRPAMVKTAWGALVWDPSRIRRSRASAPARGGPTGLSPRRP